MPERRDTAALRRINRCNRCLESFYFYKGPHRQLVSSANNTTNQKPQGLVTLRLFFFIFLFFIDTLLLRSFPGSYEIYKPQTLDIKANVSFFPPRLSFHFALKINVKMYVG